MRIGKPAIAWTALAIAAINITVALANGGGYTASDRAWREECGSCHIPYPPAFLPAESWRALMTQLDSHFGVDASVDAQTAKAVTAFLATHAGREHRPAGGGVRLRITETPWFAHEHNEVPAPIWRSASVRSAANCEACHTRAAQGDFSERALRIPR